MAAELPHGRFVLEAGMDHFGPMTHPADVAALVAATDAPLGGPRSVTPPS